MPDILKASRLRLKTEANTYELNASTPIYLISEAPQTDLDKTYGTLRIATAVSDQKCRMLRIHNRDTNEEIGHFDIRYPVARQSFDAVLTRPITGRDIQAGLRLTLGAEQSPVKIARGIEQPLDAPHLVSKPEGDRTILAEQQLRNASVCEVGWMEGCILEALETFDNFDRSKLITRANIFFEQFWQLQGLEGTLPISALARIDIESPYIDHAFELWSRHCNDAGIHSEGGRIVAETCLTLSYPMAVIARLRRDENMAAAAINQLDHCKRALASSGTIALRAFEDGRKVFENWARGVGWYTIGHAKTIRELKGWVDTSDQLRALSEALEFTSKFQRSDGLWGSFIDDPDCAPDTSGSAIIAVAAAIQAKLEPAESDTMRAQATKALNGLKAYLSDDGLLGGATQHNCGGEELQRGTYRVSHPYTLALFFELRSLLK